MTETLHCRLLNHTQSDNLLATCHLKSFTEIRHDNHTKDNPRGVCSAESYLKAQELRSLGIGHTQQPGSISNYIWRIHTYTSTEPEPNGAIRKIGIRVSLSAGGVLIHSANITFSWVSDPNIPKSSGDLEKEDIIVLIREGVVNTFNEWGQLVHKQVNTSVGSMTIDD